jgi:hypothetical protein
MSYRRWCLAFAAGATLLFVPLLAEARPGGGGGRIRGLGGGRGGGFGLEDEVPPPTWADSLDSAVNQQKPVIIYVAPPADSADEVPSAFKNPDVSKASRESAVFVRIAFKPSDPVIKERKVTSAPCLLGLDQYGNEWHRSVSVSQAVVKDFIQTIPVESTQYAEMLDRLLEQAKAREEKGDLKGALSIYRRLAAEKRKGYAPIATGREKFKSLGEKVVQDAVALLSTKEREGMQELTNLSREYTGTPVGSWSKLALLKYKIEDAKDLRSRIPDLLKLAALEGEESAEIVTAAKALLEQIEGYGQARLQDAVKKGERGETDLAKNLLRQIMGDFAGLKVAKQAQEQLAKL